MSEMNDIIKNGQLMPAGLPAQIRDKYYHVDVDPFTKSKRLFFDNSGGSFRLKDASEAFRNVDDADRLRQRLEGQGLRTRGQKSGKLTLVMVHMRGTDLDAANLKEELQRMRLGSPLQKSKKRVGGKPRPR